MLILSRRSLGLFCWLWAFSGLGIGLPQSTLLLADETAVAQPPVAADIYARYRDKAQQVIADKDALAAEGLLMEMPDVDLKLAVQRGDILLVDLIGLGDPDCIPRSERHAHYSSYYQAVAERHDLPMLGCLLRNGFYFPEDYNGLKWAGIHGHLEVVEAFIAGGANLNASDRHWGGTSLHQALYAEHEEVVDALLAAGADVNIKTDYGWTPLHATAKCGRVDFGKKLVAHGADYNVKMKNGVAPIHQALIHHKFDFARWLLEQGADYDVGVAAGLGDLESVRKLYPDPVSMDENLPIGPSPVFMAVKANQVPVVRYFISGGVDANLVDSLGRTLLIHAAESGSTEVVRYLLEQKADPYLGPRERVYSKQHYPIHMAASEGHVDVLRVLIEHGVEVDLKTHDRETPLHIAAEAGELDAIRFLAEQGADIEGQRPPYTPLHGALLYHKIDACRLLLELGADPNGPQSAEVQFYSSHPLSRATEPKNKEAFDLLMEKGAKIPAGDPSVLASSFHSGDPELIARLIAMGADVNQRNSEGKSLLAEALESQRLDVVRLLMAAGATANPEKDTFLAVHAARLGDVAIMETLLKQGLQLKEGKEAKGSWNGIRTALSAAAHENRKDMVRFLVARGMDPSQVNGEIEFDDLTLVAQAAKRGSKLAMLELIKAGGGKQIERKRGGKFEPLMQALRVAAENGHLDTFRALLRNGAWREEETAVRIWQGAAASGNLEILRLLAEHVPRNQWPEFKPSLESALRERNYEALEFLLELGADPNEMKDGQESLLHKLAQVNESPEARQQACEIALLMLKHEAQPDVVDSQKLSPAHVAVVHKNRKLAELLLEHGAARDPYLAAALGDLEFLEQAYHAEGTELLTRKLPLKKYPAGWDGFGPESSSVPPPPARGLLAWAAAGGSEEAARWLLGLKLFDLNSEEDQSPLLVALEYNHLPVAKALLKAGANPNGHPKYATTLLQAALQQNLDAVQLLIDHGASPDQTDGHGKTALHVAVEKANLPLVKLLVKVGVPLDDTYRGSTAMELAAKQSFRKGNSMAHYLLEMGADPNAGRGEILYWEVRNGELAKVEDLLKRGMNPHRQTSEGLIALVGAVDRYGQHKPFDPEGMKMIRLLLEYGADPEVPDKYKQTGLVRAKAYNYVEAVEAMRAAMSNE